MQLANPGEEKVVNDPLSVSAKGGAIPKSLMISSNLDALLEHEERTRPRLPAGTYPAVSPIRGPMSPNVISASDEIGPVSLPPPPRGVRRKRPPIYLSDVDTNGGTSALVPLSASDESQTAHMNQKKIKSNTNSSVIATASSTSNPFINPAPSLEHILLAEKQKASASLLRQSNEPPEASQNEGPKTDTVSLPQPLFRDEGSSSPDDVKKSATPETSQQSPSAIHFKYPSLPRAGDLVTTAKKNAFLLYPDSPSPNPQADDSQLKGSIIAKPLSPKNSLRSEGVPDLRQRARNKGKLLKLRESSRSSDSAEAMQEACEQSGRESRRDNDEHHINQNQPWQRRPLLSHTKSFSRSSASSSYISDSTYSPPSTVEQEPRISISSTIYPPSSSSHSHRHSILFTSNHEITSPSNSQERESFIEIYTPFNQDFPSVQDPPPASPQHDILTRIQTEQLIDSDNYQLMSILSGSPVSHPRSRSPKPPIPTTPKPLFIRKHVSSIRSSPSTSPAATSLAFEGYRFMDNPPPPTTNWLDQNERADLIRKSRKLARVFGRTPDADAMSQQDRSRTGQLVSPPNLPHYRLRHQRAPLSASHDLDNSELKQRHSARSSPSESHFTVTTGRRHSLPLSPDDVSFISITSPAYDDLAQAVSDLRIEVGSVQGEPSSDLSVYHAADLNRTESRTSFIDLSEEERADNALPISQTPKGVGNRRLTSPSAQSLFEILPPEKQLEEDRRRKRERLAKLHRFLGSQVPPSLVLGYSDPESTLPPAKSLVSETPSSSDMEDMSRKAWLRRRRSSSAAAIPPNWSDDLDRIKEDLNDKEKAINVRRAQKMEKVFGVAPPQTLYHTRHSPSPSLPPSTLTIAAKGPNSPTGFAPSQDVVYFTRNPNRSAYQKSNPRKNKRPGTSESNKQLLPKGRRSSGYDNGNIDIYPERSSIIYHQYQHSLNSLNDILDRDDRESLVELHQHLKDENCTKNASEVLQDFSKTIGHRRPSIASVKSERRRSLPARTSMVSVVSEISVSSPKPETTNFQLRRRRAAKLTQFFGVHYRELINDVLDSIENGLEHERSYGTLQADEVEDLLRRLRSLKVKREGIL